MTLIATLKEIPGSKTVFTAVAWGVLAALIPVVCSDQEFSGATAMAFFFVAGMIFIRSGLFEILAIEGDRVVGKETLAIALGKERTLNLLRVLPGFYRRPAPGRLGRGDPLPGLRPERFGPLYPGISRPLPPGPPGIGPVVGVPGGRQHDPGGHAGLSLGSLNTAFRLSVFGFRLKKTIFVCVCRAGAASRTKVPSGIEESRGQVLPKTGKQKREIVFCNFLLTKAIGHYNMALGKTDKTKGGGIKTGKSLVRQSTERRNWLPLS